MRSFDLLLRPADIDGPPAQDKPRSAKAEEVVRLYDAILGHTNELAEVASQVGGAAGEALMDECAAKVWHP